MPKYYFAIAQMTEEEDGTLSDAYSEVDFPYDVKDQIVMDFLVRQITMYKCPKCGNWMQWCYQYGQAYWICTQCGYYPQVTYSNSTKGAVINGKEYD